jgi:hypothetical protein
VRYVDESVVEEYIAQGWRASFSRYYYTSGKPRACFIVSLDLAALERVEEMLGESL